eukprot:1472400-Rhodomonas_salina.1
MACELCTWIPTSTDCAGRSPTGTSGRGGHSRSRHEVSNSCMTEAWKEAESGCLKTSAGSKASLTCSISRTESPG